MEFCPHLRVALGKVEEEGTCAKPHGLEWELQDRLGVVVFLQMKVRDCMDAGAGPRGRGVLTRNPHHKCI